MTLFCSDIGANDHTLDSAYAYLLLGQGIIVTCAYVLFVPKLFRALSENGDYACLIILTVLFVYGLSERLWMCVDYDAPMLAWSYLVYGKHSGKRSLDGRPSRNPLYKS